MKVADSMKGAQPMARRNPLERPDHKTKIVATIGPASNRRRPSNA
jgi:hypothetical protein